MSSSSIKVLQIGLTELEWRECARLAQFAVTKLRAKLHLSPEEVEDLASEGTIAAVGALRTWQPEKGKKSTWLLRRVNGEILDTLKKLRYAGLTGVLKEGVSVVTASFLANDDEDSGEEGTTGAPALEWEAILGTTEDYDSNAEALAIAIAVEQLPKADRELVEGYYGLSGIGPTRSLRQLGQAHKLSGEAVRLRLNRILTDLAK